MRTNGRFREDFETRHFGGSVRRVVVGTLGTYGTGVRSHSRQVVRLNINRHEG